MNTGILKGLAKPDLIVVTAELAYAEITVGPTPTTSTTLADVAGLQIDVMVGSRPITVEVWTAGIANNTANFGAVMVLMEGATTLGAVNAWNPSGSVVQSFPGAFIKRRLTPSAGKHTYKVQWRAFNGGTASLLADPSWPAFIRATEG